VRFGCSGDNVTLSGAVDSFGGIGARVLRRTGGIGGFEVSFRSSYSSVKGFKRESLGFTILTVPVRRLLSDLAMLEGVLLAFISDTSSSSSSNGFVDFLEDFCGDSSSSKPSSPNGLREALYGSLSGVCSSVDWNVSEVPNGLRSSSYGSLKCFWLDSFDLFLGTGTCL